MTVLFVYVDAFRPSRQFFSQVGTFSRVTGLNQCVEEAEVKCLAHNNGIFFSFMAGLGSEHLSRTLGVSRF